MRPHRLPAVSPPVLEPAPSDQAATKWLANMAEDHRRGSRMNERRPQCDHASGPALAKASPTVAAGLAPRDFAKSRRADSASSSPRAHSHHPGARSSRTRFKSVPLRQQQQHPPPHAPISASGRLCPWNGGNSPAETAELACQHDVDMDHRQPHRRLNMPAKAVGLFCAAVLDCPRIVEAVGRAAARWSL